MKIKLYDKNCLPSYTNKFDACMDCRARTTSKWTQEAKNLWTVKIPLGFGCLVPDGFALLLYSRSGHGFKHNISLANSVGVIDRSFGLNEIYCKLTTVSNTEPPQIKQYDRVCQMMLVQVPKIKLELVDDISFEAKDGFGSSGVK